MVKWSFRKFYKYTCLFLDDQSIVANIVEDLVQNISGSPEAFKPNRIDSDNESNEGNSTLPKIIINKKVYFSTDFFLQFCDILFIF
jgi:hypothetical protein